MQTTETLKMVVRIFSEHQRFVMFLLTIYGVITGKPWLTNTNPQINFPTNKVKVNCESKILRREMSGQDSEESRSIIESFFITGRRARHALTEGVLAWVTVTGEESREAETSSKGENRQGLVKLLQEFTDMFPDELPNKIPPKRAIDNEVKTDDGEKPTSRAAYRLLKLEMDELQVQLADLLRRGFIEPSKSTGEAPVFFVKKADGSLRMVCDWRGQSRITIKNQVCLPNIDDLLDAVQGSTYFTMVDLRSGYNQIRIVEAAIQKNDHKYSIWSFPIHYHGIRTN